MNEGADDLNDIQVLASMDNEIYAVPVGNMVNAIESGAELITTMRDALLLIETTTAIQPRDSLCGFIYRLAHRALGPGVAEPTPVPLVMYCPRGHQHVDEGEWATRPHRTHQCQTVIPCGCPALYHGDCAKIICGFEWRPAAFSTVGVSV